MAKMVRLCIDCGISIIVEARFPGQTRCLSCFWVALGRLIACVEEDGVKGAIRRAILSRLFVAEIHLRYPRMYKFWEWVVMPKTSGGRLGFKNWCRYIRR